MFGKMRLLAVLAPVLVSAEIFLLISYSLGSFVAYLGISVVWSYWRAQIVEASSRRGWIVALPV
jgi:hypothetical protein